MMTMEKWVLGNVGKLLFSEKFHDVVFQFPNDDKIFAHAIILSFTSTVFDAQLTGPLKERNIKVTDSTADTFRAFLRCLYTGELRATSDNMFDLAYLADKYMLPNITEEIEVCFEYELKVESNFCKIFWLDKLSYFSDTYKGDFQKRLLTRAAKLLTSPLFLDLCADQVGQLVRCKDLAVHEFDLYKAVVSWAKHKCIRQKVEPTAIQMRKYVKDFLHELRMPTLTYNELTMAEGVCRNNLLHQTEKQSLLIYCAGDTSEAVPFKTRPRRASLDLIVASANSDESGTVVESTHSTFFVPKCNFRLVAVTFVIDIVDMTAIPEDSKAVLVNFELKPVPTGKHKDNTTGAGWKFSWTRSSLKADKQNRVVYCSCSTRVLIPLYANQKYELISRCGPGVRMHAYTGVLAEAASFVSTNRTTTPRMQLNHSHYFERKLFQEMFLVFAYLTVPYHAIHSNTISYALLGFL